MCIEVVTYLDSASLVVLRKFSLTSVSSGSIAVQRIFTRSPHGVCSRSLHDATKAPCAFALVRATEVFL